MKVLVCIFDKKALFSLNLVPVRSTDEAIRQFNDLLADKETMLGKHPGDFALYEVGRFDEDKMAVVGHPVPELVFDGSEFKN